ncbi:MAG: penicillin acylase family protein [Acidobacteriota bacterium]
MRSLFAALTVIGTLVVGTVWAHGQNVEISVAGIKAPVSVTRDARSIPYISASTDGDLYFTQGYVTASDRLWQMDLLRRVARGETAEIFGATALNEDKRWRRFGFAGIAEQNLQYLSPQLRSALDSYAAGVNAYISTLDAKTLPVEFRILQYSPKPWQPTDTIVIGKILADALSSTWRQDLLRESLQSLPKEKFAELTNQVTPDDVVLFGSDRASAPTNQTRRSGLTSETERIADELDLARERSLSRVGLYAEDLAASNNWVISGKRTANGKPILANDPHLTATAPGIWYLVHLTAPGLRVAGVTFPGVPGVVLGHNDSIAWGATNVGPDVQDLYVETFDDKGNYETATGLKPLIVRDEKINVRRNPLKPETDAVDFPVTSTEHGPIIIEEAGKRYALKWTAFDPRNNELEAFFLANRAGNWEQFQSALKGYGGSAQNFVYADVKGNIGWYAAGKIPIRRVGDGALPYVGATTDGDWIGSVPFEELPHLYNPKSGLIVTANQRTVGTDYKYPAFIRDAASPWRARRIYDLLSANPKIDADAVRDVQYDVTNMPLKRFAHTVVRSSAASPATIAVLKQWDGRMTTDSAGALITNEMRNCAAAKIADANKPAPAALIRERILQNAVDGNKAAWLPKQFADYGALLRACDAEVAAGFTTKYGADRAGWTWGRVFRSRFTHPLGSVPFIGAQFATPAVEIAGSGQTPNVGSSVSMRIIAIPGLWDETRHVIPLGESGDPQSPFFKDQFEAWRTGTPTLFPFSESAVEKVAVRRTKFVPSAK